MNYFTYEKIIEIFNNMKQSENFQKINIKRAENKRFNSLFQSEKLTFFGIADCKDEKIANYKKEFLIKMLSIYEKQNGSKKFEDLLYTIYKNGSSTAKQKISLLLDEGFYDNESFTYDVMRYIDSYLRNENFDVISLTYDVLNYKTDISISNRWMNALLGIKNNQNKEK